MVWAIHSACAPAAMLSLVGTGWPAWCHFRFGGSGSGQ